MKKFLLPLCLLGSALVLPAFADGDTAPAAQYQFVASQVDSPDGDAIYEVDFVDATNHPTTVVQIVAATKTLDQMSRAKIIADRLQKASLADKSFWSDLKPDSKNSQLVIALSKSDDGGYIVTADARSAEITGMSQDKYAAYLLTQIKTALTGKLRDAKFDYQLVTPEEKLERANLYRMQAEKAYQQKNEARSEKLYLQAKRVDPDYATPYIALANLYLRQGKTSDALAVVKDGLSHNLKLQELVDHLIPTQSQAMAGLIKKAQQAG